jgi:hypothetical protein
LFSCLVSLRCNLEVQFTASKSPGFQLPSNAGCSGP